MLPPYTWFQEGGEPVSEILAFITSVMAKIVAYYLCKWFDKMSSGNKPE